MSLPVGDNAAADLSEISEYSEGGRWEMPAGGVSVPASGGRYALAVIIARLVIGILRVEVGPAVQPVV